MIVSLSEQGDSSRPIGEALNTVTRRIILTGAPGAGKTAIVRRLELDGFRVVEEAATDLIALRQAEGVLEPWTEPTFIDDVLALQQRREVGAMALTAPVVIFDRSPACSLALARHLGRVPSTALSEAVEAMAGSSADCRVLLVRGLGFVTPTAARRLSLAEAQRFECLHEAVYRELGFEPIDIPPGPLQQRANLARRLAAGS